MASTEGETQISKADETNKEEKHAGNEEANQDPNFDPNEEYEEEKKEEGKDDQEEGKEDDQAGLDAHLPEEIVQSSETDQKSIYVKNVDYASTKEELTEFFKDCGKINRVTIILDKFTGHPKGFAYIEFTEKESVENAKILDGATFKGRVISVLPKRTNQPHKGKATGRGRGRGRGGSWYRGGPGFYMRGPIMYPMMGRGMRRGGYRPY